MSFQQLLRLALGLMLFFPFALQAQTAADEEIPIEVTENSTDPKVMFVVDDSGSMLAQVTHEDYNEDNYDPNDNVKVIPSLMFRVNSGGSAPNSSTSSQLVIAEMNWGLFGIGGNAWTATSFSNLRNTGVPANSTCNNTSNSRKSCYGPGPNSPTRGTNTLALHSNPNITGNSIFSLSNLTQDGGSNMEDSDGNEYLYADYRRNQYAREGYNFSGTFPKFDADGDMLTVRTRLYATPGGKVKFNGKEVTLSAGWYDIRYLQWMFYDATVAQLAALPGASRMEVVKDVLAQLVIDNPDIEFGISTFNGSTHAPGNWGASVGDELWFPLGRAYRGSRAKIRKWIGTSAADLIAEIATLTPSGGTPLTNTYIEALRYFGGERANDGNCSKGGNSCQYQSPLGSCSQGFAVLLSDGLPSSESNNSFKGSWVRDYDGDNEESRSSNYRCNSTTCPEFLDDAGYYAYNNDMVAGVDGMQNVRTYAVGIGLNPPLFNDLASNGGTGQAFRADTVDEITLVLQNIVGSLKSTAVGAAGVAVAEVFGENGMVFRPHASALDWSGGVDVFIAENGNLTKQFDMGEVLAERDVDNNPRRILAGYDVDGDGNTTTTISFDKANAVDLQPLLFKNFIDGTLDANYLADPLSDFNDIESTNKLIDFIHGFDVDQLRTRDSSLSATAVARLGDVVHSRPIHVSANNSRNSWIEGNTVYVRSRRSEPDVLLVGANDGMLHAFDIESGEELWAYIPSTLLEHLEILSRPRYNTEYHRYYVDGQINVKDVYIRGGWKTIAMFGLAGGGSSYIVLDITDRDNPSLLFERNDGSIYGESSSEPALVLTGGSPTSFSGSDFNWYMAVGTGADKPTGGTELVVYNLNSNLPTPTTLTLDSVAPVGTRASKGIAVVNSDRDGNDDRIYVGSGQHMYRVLLSGTPGSWTTERFYTGNLSTQPITAAPSVLLANNPLYDEENGSGASAMPYAIGVYFGTGRYELPSDVSNYGGNTQNIVGLFDPIHLEGDTYVNRHSNINKSQLQNQSIGSFGSTRDDIGVYSISSDKKGFYINLDTSINLSGGFIDPVGMVTHSPAVVRGAIVWSTFLPVQAGCSSGGHGFLQVMNFRHGGQIVADYSNEDEGPFYNGGIRDMNDDGDYDSNDLHTAYTQGVILPVVDARVESVDLGDSQPYRYDGNLEEDDIRLTGDGTGGVLPSVSSLGERGVPGPPSILFQDGQVIIQSADIATVASDDSDEGSDNELVPVCVIVGTEVEEDGSTTTIRETISVPESQVDTYIADGAEHGECPEDSDSEKMTICHSPPDNPANKYSMEISVDAWPEYQARGDTEGPCDDDEDDGDEGDGDEDGDEDEELEKPDQWDINLYNIPLDLVSGIRTIED